MSARADRQGDQDAEPERSGCDDAQQRRPAVACDVRDPTGGRNQGEHQVDATSAVEGEWLAGNHSGQLSGGDQGAGQRDAADQHVQDGGEGGADRQLAEADRTRMLHRIAEGDQRRGSATDGVEQADQLRHGRHLDPPGGDQSGGSSAEQTDREH